MKTAIDSTRPETTNFALNEPESGEHAIGLLIAVAALVLAFVICRIVMIQLETLTLLDQLHAFAGQPLLTKS